MSEAINWDDIGRRLRAPFKPDEVDFRPQTGKGEATRAQAVAYIDARAVMERLDDVVGLGNWSFTYEPVIVTNKEVQVAKGRLMIYGVAKEDVGEASNFDPSKGCVSDALKRAAVLWGIGRYLYGIAGTWVTLDEHKRIKADDLRKLRANLPRPTAPAPVGATASPAPQITASASERQEQLRAEGRAATTSTGATGDDEDDFTFTVDDDLDTDLDTDPTPTPKGKSWSVPDKPSGDNGALISGSQIAALKKLGSQCGYADDPPKMTYRQAGTLIAVLTREVKTALAQGRRGDAGAVNTAMYGKPARDDVRAATALATADEDPLGE